MHFRFHTGPNISLCHSNVGTFYLKCSQSLELKRQYKESNRPRVERFECHGKLTIRIDVPGKEAMAKLSHDCQHEHPVDVTMPPEVKQEIEKNLHMDPLQLRTHLHSMFDISIITTKQIHYWWSTFSQRFYKSDENQVASTCNFFERNRAVDCQLCYNITTSQVTTNNVFIKLEIN